MFYKSHGQREAVGGLDGEGGVAGADGPAGRVTYKAQRLGTLFEVSERDVVAVMDAKATAVAEAPEPESEPPPERPAPERPNTTPPASNKAPTKPGPAATETDAPTGTFAVAPLSIIDGRGKEIARVDAKGNLTVKGRDHGRFEGGSYSYRGHVMLSIERDGTLFQGTGASRQQLGSLAPTGKATLERGELTLAADGTIELVRKGKRRTLDATVTPAPTKAKRVFALAVILLVLPRLH